MKQISILVLMLVCCLQSSAQQLILGSVRDKFLKTPLIDVRLTLLSTDSVVVQDSIEINFRKRDGERYGSANFRLKLPKKTCTYLLHASLDGYEDDWQTLSVKAEIDDAWGLDRPMELRRLQTKTLGEVTVTATKLKMFHRGDTIVYDATAFKLPDGSMLDDLIRQMPGVIMNDDGEIFVNGRKVDELLLGSRSFFSGNHKVLLENLPYYTVKNVKVYEKESDRNRAVGYEMEQKKYVMDVNLKDEYKNGYVGNAEIAGGTEKHWLGRTFLLGFTDQFRFTLLANANNVNEKRHIGESNSWKPESMPRSQLTTKSIAGEIDYQSKNGNLKDNLMVDFLATKDYGESMQRRELFMEGRIPYSTFKAFNTSHANRLLARNKFKMTIPNKVYADLGVDYTYNKYKGNTEALSEDFLESINTRLCSSGFNNGYSYTINAGGFISPRIDNFFRSLTAFYGMKHSDEKNETARGFLTEQFANPSMQKQFNSNAFRHKETSFNIHPQWSTEIGSNLRLEIQDRNEYSKRYEHDYLYHPDTLALPSCLDALLAITDVRNSYESDYWSYINAPSFALKWKRYIAGQYMKVEYISWDLRFSSVINSEHLSYLRNNVTQDNKRTSVDFTSSFNFKILPTKKEGEVLLLQMMHEQGNASMFDLLDYRDDAMPQVVKLGNPNLKGIAVTSFGVNFTDRESKHRGQQYHISGNMDYYHQQIAQSVEFNTENSRYTYQPKNVNGAYEVKSQFDFSRFIDKKQRWSWQTTLNANYSHSIDHVLQTGKKESTPNAVNTTTLHNGQWLQYQLKDFTIKAIGDIAWRHSKSKLEGFNIINAWEYQYGITTRYTIPKLKTTLSADANMYSRRGYGSNELNTDDFVLNASLSQSLLKGRLIARIEAFDLLHNLSNTQYAVNAQGRTVTWYRSLPHYVMAHLVYHWNKNPKKK